MFLNTAKNEIIYTTFLRCSKAKAQIKLRPNSEAIVGDHWRNILEGNDDKIYSISHYYSKEFVP